MGQAVVPAPQEATGTSSVTPTGCRARATARGAIRPESNPLLNPQLETRATAVVVSWSPLTRDQLEQPHVVLANGDAR
jgi:hypothetical protein